MVEIMLTGTIVIIGNGWLLVYLLNNKKKLERELEIYKNRLDNASIGNNKLFMSWVENVNAELERINPNGYKRVYKNRLNKGDK